METIKIRAEINEIEKSGKQSMTQKLIVWKDQQHKLPARLTKIKRKDTNYVRNKMMKL